MVDGEHLLFPTRRMPLLSALCSACLDAGCTPDLHGTPGTWVETHMTGRRSETALLGLVEKCREEERSRSAVGPMADTTKQTAAY